MSGIGPTSTMVPRRRTRAPILPHDAGLKAEGWCALLVTFTLGVQFRLSPDINAGYIAAAIVLPVTFAVVRHYRAANLIGLLCVLAAASGLILTWLDGSEGGTDHSRTIVQTARVLGLGAGMLAMLWARSTVGSRATIFSYSVGYLCGLAIPGLDPDNFWKFSLSIPVTLVVLSFPGIYRRAAAETVALVVLSAISALNDTRGLAAMTLMTAALIITQRDRRPDRLVRRGKATSVLVRLGLISLAVFYASQALILDGTLGDAAKERTAEQIQTSGSVLLGGRPELGASIALIEARPTGYGAGALASPDDVLTAKSGMAELGYDPNNGYVEIYMFGDGFEVHSVLGDLWLLYGVAGIILGLTVLGAGVFGMARALSMGTASAALLFLCIRIVWDCAFSPYPSAMATLMLALAMALPLKGTMPRHRREA